MRQTVAVDAYAPVNKAASEMARLTRAISHASTKRLRRVGGLPAVSALFAVSPERVEQLFFDQRMKPSVGAFCTKLARMGKPYRLIGADGLERVAGTWRAVFG
jgi:RNA methyltransferase, TrmH family